jgi:NAD(P)-dependent dehydrogenase (short-subunit alcohol dehydrogenase family)
VETKMLEEGVKEISRMKNVHVSIMKKWLKENMPIKRFITPEECARLVVFLASEDAGGITGQAINVSGGLETH